MQECRARLRDGSVDALETAIECHSTTLLEGFQARSAAFEQWLEERRRELRRELLQAIERAASQRLPAGDLPGATQLLERLVMLEPANERAQRELMECLARLGRHTDALRQYRACVEALAATWTSRQSRRPTRCIATSSGAGAGQRRLSL